MKENVFGMNVSKLLEMNNMTQCELAKQVGVTEVSISRYINGERIPNVDIALKIALTLQTTIEYLMGATLEFTNGDVGFYYAQDIISKYYDSWTREQKKKIVVKLFDLG